MSLKPLTLTVTPPEPLERCDQDNIAKAYVSALVMTSEGTAKKLVFCYHHWDSRSRKLETSVVAHFDPREAG